MNRFGTLTVRRVGEDLVVDRADERVTFSDDLVRLFAPEFSGEIGEEFTIRASNGAWTYRIDASYQFMETKCWHASLVGGVK